MNHDSITLSSRIKKNKKCVNRATCLVFYINKISLTGASSNFLCFRVFNLRLMYHMTTVNTTSIRNYYFTPKTDQNWPKRGRKGNPQIEEVCGSKKSARVSYLVR